MNSRLNICLSLYRYLANAYPHEFRMVYGEDLDRMGEDAVPDAWRRYGLWGLVRLLADIALRLPAEYLAEIRQDTVYAVRTLAKAPAFTAVAVLSMAIGIGVCSVILSGSNAMLGPLPGAHDPASLMTPRKSVSYPYFEHYRDQRQVPLAATAFLTNVPFAVAPASDRNAKAERFYGHLVSPEYFSTLGVSPAAGRFFSRETEKAGMAAVVVVSDRFWRSNLNADPQAVGRRMRLNGQPAIIVGIAPKDFLGVWPWSPADLFVPVTCGSLLAPELGDDLLHRGDLERFRMLLRLPHGVSMAAAGAALDTVTRALDQEAPDAERDRDRKSRQLRLIPAGTIMQITPEMRVFVLVFNVVLWAMVLALLCANLANLLLARGSQRRREIAVRLSVGASRGRLVRQFLTESVLLTLTGGLAGILLAYGITHAMSSMQVSADTPLRTDLRPDLRVLLLTLAISVVTGVACGLAPALSSLRTDIGLALKEGTMAAPRGYRRFGLRNLFVVAQVAASLMLLLATGYMVTGYRHATRLDPGFDTANLNLFSIDPMRDGYSAEKAQALFATLPEQMSRLNGVRAVALAGGVPFSSMTSDRTNTRVSSSTGAEAGREIWCNVFRERIGADYFATLGVRLAYGREFDPRDQQSEAPPGTAIPAVINQSAARALFGAENPIGRRIHEAAASYTVVGVTHDVRSGYLPPKPVATLFLPLTAEWFVKSRAPRATVLVRGVAGGATLTAVREELAALHPELTVFNVRTMRENLDKMNAFMEWSSSIYVVLGLFSLLLACIGLGGVTAYAVAQRRKEIGIRMALGARAGQVRRLVLREGTLLIAAGSVVGIACAAAVARGAASVTAQLAAIFETRTGDPRLMVGAPLVLATLSLLACYLPARRATQVDPVRALREE